MWKQPNTKHEKQMPGNHLCNCQVPAEPVWGVWAEQAEQRGWDRPACVPVPIPVPVSPVCPTTLGSGAGCFPCWFTAALVMGTIVACCQGKLSNRSKTRRISRIPSGSVLLTNSAQSGPTLCASEGATPELLLVNRDCKCHLIPAKDTLWFGKMEAK